jgi:hypothetical protein
MELLAGRAGSRSDSQSIVITCSLCDSVSSLALCSRFVEPLAKAVITAVEWSSDGEGVGVRGRESGWLCCGLRFAVEYGSKTLISKSRNYIVEL